MTSIGPWKRLRRFVLWAIRRRITKLTRVSHHGFSLLIDSRDYIIGRSLYTGREWEPFVSSLFSLMDLAGTVAIDVGANIGIHTVELAMAVGAAGRVIAFEPESRSFDLLVRNLSRNGVVNTSVEKIALGNHSGRGRLAVHASNLGDHRILREAESTSEPFQDVQIATLDDFCLPLGPNAVSLIKIDVQGFEGQVLQGAEATIDANPDLWLILEIPSVRSRALTPAPELVRWLVERGFHGVELHLDRMIPLLDPEAYSMLFGNDIHVLFSRNQRRLEDLLHACREIRLRSSGL